MWEKVCRIQPNILRNRQKRFPDRQPRIRQQLILIIEIEQFLDVGLRDEIDKLARVRNQFKTLARHLNLLIIKLLPLFHPQKNSV